MSNDRRMRLGAETSASMSKLDSLRAESTVGQDRKWSILKELQKDLAWMEQRQRRLRRKQKDALHELRKLRNDDNK